MSILPILILIALWGFGIYSVSIGYKYVRDKKSVIHFGNDFQRKVVSYRGKIAIFHGLAFVTIGVFSLILGVSISFGLVNPNVATIGCIAIPASILLIMGTVSVFGRSSKEG